MLKNLHLLSLFYLILCATNLIGQTQSKGPIITEFGEVFAVDRPEFAVDVTKEYKAVFDIMNSPESHQEINKSIETVARFLNMHAQSGVPVEQLKAAVVIHNAASKDVLSNAAYKKRYGTENPNAELLQALLNADVQVIFCGQSAAARDIPREDLIEGIRLSLSAMNALIQLQDKKYRLIKF
ncbi:MAG: DsrE family protein [Maribacter sp.]|nr:DsrE family protein [Maribacter sp.]